MAGRSAQHPEEARLRRRLRRHRLPDIEAVHQERVAFVRSDGQRARQQAREGAKCAPRRARSDTDRAAYQVRPHRQARIEGAPRDIRSGDDALSEEAQRVFGQRRGPYSSRPRPSPSANYQWL
jgi:hypothetical protein